MEAKWYSGGLFFNANALRTRWVCSVCCGVKCEILLAISEDAPEHCLREVLDEASYDDELH